MKKQFLTYAACLLAGLTCTLNTPVAAQNCPGTTVAGMTGSRGPRADQLNFPYGVAVDGAGNIYVADYSNHRIQKFAPGSVAGSSGTTVAGITGSYGSGTAQLNNPVGVAIDGAGNIYVADLNNHRIQKFAPGSTAGSSGTTVAGSSNGTRGSEAYQLNNPYGVAVDGAGNIYVADQNNHRIQKFAPGSTAGSSGTTVAGSSNGTRGSEADQLNYPAGIAIDGAGYIYVADLGNYRIQKFASGSTQGSSGTTVAGITGSRGNQNNQLNSPYGVAVDGAGNVYVADQGNQRIQKFAPGSTAGSNGTTVAGVTGISGTGDAQLNSPYGVAVDGAGNIYVADYSNNRIQKFAPQAAAASLSSLTADETGCPVRLRASGNGQQFVFTGPQGYVFSQVYRTRGDYQPVAIDVRQPGTYRLTADVSGGCGNSNTTAVQTVTVTRSCP